MLTPNAVRLSALVAAAVSAGYLWRAALDHHAEQKVPLAVPPAIHFKPSAGLFDSLTGLRSEAARITQQETLSPANAEIASTSAQPDSVHATGSKSVVFIRTEPAAPPSSHRSPPSGSTGSSHGRPKPKPPGRSHSKPPPPPPAPPPAAPPPPAPPAPPPAPPAPPAGPPPAPPPPPPPVSSGTRPGWGKGDRHHVHTGPPGHSGRKSKGKSEQGGHQQSGGKSWKHDDNQGDDNQQGNDDHQGAEEQHGNSHQGGQGNQGHGNQGGGHGNHH